MSTAIGVSADGVRIPIPRKRVVDVARAVLRAERVRDAMLSVTFVSTRAIRALNREHLGRDRATDVIAFAFKSAGRTKAALVGDIYVAPQVARFSARANGVSYREEVVRLIVHGTLHVLGYDHPESDARVRSPMWRKQEALVGRLGRPARRK